MKVLETKVERVEVRLLKGPGILVCPDCCERGKKNSYMDQNDD